MLNSYVIAKGEEAIVTKFEGHVEGIKNPVKVSTRSSEKVSIYTYLFETKPAESTIDGHKSFFMEEGKQPNLKLEEHELFAVIDAITEYIVHDAENEFIPVKKILRNIESIDIHEIFKTSEEWGVDFGMSYDKRLEVAKILSAVKQFGRAAELFYDPEETVAVDLHPGQFLQLDNKIYCVDMFRDWQL